MAPTPEGARVPEGVRAAYQGLVCDLDGVVYRGRGAIPHAVEALRGAGPVVFATNNSSRIAAEVAAHLAGLGLPDAQVVTSATAGAGLLAADLEPGAEVLTVGGPGVPHALEAAGLSPVPRRSDRTLAVLQGWAMTVTLADLAEASLAIEAGARWIATNTDRTLPTAEGLVPGNGTLVAAVAAATGATPEVAGKPEAPLYRAAAGQLGADAAELLAVGDRLDTDILGAAAAGQDSLWVLTGVDGFATLAGSTARPTYAAADLRALGRPYPTAGGLDDPDPAVVAAAGLRLVLRARDADGVASAGAVQAGREADRRLATVRAGAGQ